MLKKLVEASSRNLNVRGVIGDGAYDSRKNFNFLDRRGIEQIIRIRSNAVRGSRGCPSRREALTIQRSGSEEWGRRYGSRWIAESTSSWIKRIFGEYITAKKLENMVREIALKALPIQPPHRNDGVRRWIGRQMKTGERRHHKHLCNKALTALIYKISSRCIRYFQLRNKHLLRSLNSTVNFCLSFAL